MAGEPQSRKPLQHGKRTTYVRGCRCDPCREANRLYGVNLSQRRRTGGPILVPLRPVNANPDGGTEPQYQDTNMPNPDEPGRVERQVAAEIEQLTDRVRKGYTGLIESALAMARIIDNTNLATTHPSAQRQLMVALDKLHSVSVGKKGGLAAVAEMSNRGASKPAAPAEPEPANG